MAKCQVCKKRESAVHVRVSVAGIIIYDKELCKTCHEGDEPKGIKAFDSQEIRRKWDLTRSS